jgi:diguanylate cyclase (GGDEF)-like protein
MNKPILIISDQETDHTRFTHLLAPKGYSVKGAFCRNAGTLLDQTDTHAAVIMDYDLGPEMVDACLAKLHDHHSNACMILYGDLPDPANISKVLQKGVYAYLERRLIPDRIIDTLMGGLENRKAFIHILKMMDQLETEKTALKRKNQELHFINRLSSKVAYDLHWDEIMPRILDAGLLEVVDISLFSVFYRIGDSWHLTCHAPEKSIRPDTFNDIKQDITAKFMTLSGEEVDPEAVSHTQLSQGTKTAIDMEDIFSCPPPLVLPLNTGATPMGMVSLVPRSPTVFTQDNSQMMSTLANILAMSLNNAQKFNRLREQSACDGLTGLCNHKRFKEIVKNEFQRSARYGKSITLVMLDGDGFKEINDTFGHLAGDMVLQELAGCLKESVRGTDIVARYGGDEFAILLPETELEMAKIMVQRIENRITGHRFEWNGHLIAVSVSHGIATTAKYDSGHSSPSPRQMDEQDLIHQADMNLYRMKQARSQKSG